MSDVAERFRIEIAEAVRDAARPLYNEIVELLKDGDPATKKRRQRVAERRGRDLRNLILTFSPVATRGGVLYSVPERPVPVGSEGWITFTEARRRPRRSS